MAERIGPRREFREIPGTDTTPKVGPDEAGEPVDPKDQPQEPKVKPIHIDYQISIEFHPALDFSKGDHFPF